MTLYVLLDGAEDHDIPEFNGKRPMDVARMPFFDSVVKFKGKTTGRAYTHLFLNEFFTGCPPKASRAAIEALGLGMDMGDRTAYRLSPASISDGMVDWIYDLDDIHEDLVQISRDNMHMLDHLDPEVNFFLNGRAILTMRCDLIPELPSPPVPAPYVDVPGDLGRFVTAIAEQFNGITEYPWGCGRIPNDITEPFIDRMTAVSNTPTALGISRSLGHDIRRIEDLDERFGTAKDLLDHGDVFLHVDEIDEYSHQRDPQKKVRILEYADKLMAKHFDEDDDIVFFVDHGTSSLTGEHILMDVPFWTSFDMDVPGTIPLNDLIPSITHTLNGKR